MISCAQCQTQNGLDSKFCRNCGSALPDDLLRQASDKHEQMVKEGYTLFSAGRTNEALLVAHAAVEENPNSPNAQSLLGMCFERLGQVAEALECFEKVLTISPDSTLDRLKVTQLRTSLTQHMKADTNRSQRTAFMVAACVVLLACGVGIAVLASGGAKSKSVATNDPAPANMVRSFTQATASDLNRGASNMQQTPPAQQPDINKIVSDAVSRARAQERASSTVDEGPLEPPFRIPNGIGITSDNPSPTVPAANHQGDPEPAPAGGTDQTSKSGTAPAGAPDTSPKSSAPPDPEPNNGVIEIAVSRPKGTGDQGPADSSNQLEALMRTAKNQFLLQQYDAAARSYQRALQAGGDPGMINQRLGMCYEKLHKQNEAISAYNQAASAFEGAINAGHGDVKRLRSGLDSCKEAVKALSMKG